MSNYSRGANKERSVVNKARAEGKIALRSAGSHSPIDVVIIDNNLKEIRLVQCKPRSMQKSDYSPTAAAQRLIDELAKLDGIYKVTTEVSFTRQWTKHGDKTG